MPPVLLAFQNNRPSIEVELSLPSGGPTLVRRLLADTGAGNRQSLWQLILDGSDCLRYGGTLMGHVQLGGAYSGFFPVYAVNIRIAQLNFDEPLAVVGVPQVPQGFDGIAGFKLLNRFHYGNFGNPDCFGLDLLPIP